MLDFNEKYNDEKGWIVSEKAFHPNEQGKTESIMYLGNGYMGVRSASEENYLKQSRGTFVSGTFNKATADEVTELPVFPDVTAVTINLDGVDFSLTDGNVKEYTKQLNLLTGELERKVKWLSESGKLFEIVFRRFVSLADMNVLGAKVMIRSSEPFKLRISSGINGQVTNSGAMHFEDGTRRIFDGQLLNYCTKTTESKIDVVINTIHRPYLEDTLDLTPSMSLDRRLVRVTYDVAVPANKMLTIEKMSTVATSRDPWFESYPVDDISRQTISKLKELSYDVAFERSRSAWESYWSRVQIDIQTDQAFEKLAVHFAQYHLRAMVPAHDSRMGVAAKALSGEGYKGHSFWDTEMFIFPYFLYTQPEIARNLLMYRYHGLAGAKEKARSNGYDGAQYPWEAAWITDGEVTPLWGAVDIVTGQATQILSGQLEQHITSDIIYALSKYYQTTGDQGFLKTYGYEMIFETAIFWMSRFEYNEIMDRFEIRRVMGPDEYKEDVNNNAYTNYFAHFNVSLAVSCFDALVNEPLLLDRLDKQTNIRKWIDRMRKDIKKLYLPLPDESGVIPQDDTYMGKRTIDLEKYKRQENVDTIFGDYNIKQIGDIQVTKQADVLLLIQLLGDEFEYRVKESNWNYYEKRTLHDSSLSLSTHAILACDLGLKEEAHNLFIKACEIDLGQNMHTSNKGIHAASLGGIWQIVSFGFAGIHFSDTILHVSPRLPKHWEELSIPLTILGRRIELVITRKTIKIHSDERIPLAIEIEGNRYILNQTLEVDYN